MHPIPYAILSGLAVPAHAPGDGVMSFARTRGINGLEMSSSASFGPGISPGSAPAASCKPLIRFLTIPPTLSSDLPSMAIPQPTWAPPTHSIPDSRRASKWPAPSGYGKAGEAAVDDDEQLLLFRGFNGPSVLVDQLHSIDSKRGNAVYV